MFTRNGLSTTVYTPPRAIPPLVSECATDIHFSLQLHPLDNRTRLVVLPIFLFLPGFPRVFFSLLSLWDKKRAPPDFFLFGFFFDFFLFSFWLFSLFSYADTPLLVSVLIIYYHRFGKFYHSPHYGLVAFLRRSVVSAHTVPGFLVFLSLCFPCIAIFSVM